MHRRTLAVRAAALMLAAALPRPAASQAPDVAPVALAAGARPVSPHREAAERARELRLVVSVNDRTLWLKHGTVTLYEAPVAVGREVVIEWEGRAWNFTTPLGRRVVRGKERNPVWSPPDWHYVELAVFQGWKLVWLRGGQRVPLADGGYVTTRGGQVGRVAADGSWHPVARGDEAVFDGTLFAPPPGSINRRMTGILGAYKLDTGDGIYLHGTDDLASVGTASTHGCMRLRDEDLAQLYRMVPVGTPVYIY
ncbi:MAG TPA: L,D-transpeptidase [Longimicrobium sp.]|nr:L,D-transpeptidase [Longimicrobium sp.]